MHAERTTKGQAVKIAPLAACAAVALAGFTDPARADGANFAAGVLGGLAAGAIIGSAVAPRPYYGPAPVYVAPPAYVGPAPMYEAPACYWTRGEPVWNGYAWVRPRVQVCD
jgi:hypothetical protein